MSTHAAGRFTAPDDASGPRPDTPLVLGDPTDRRHWPGASRQYRRWIAEEDAQAYRDRLEAEWAEG